MKKQVEKNINNSDLNSFIEATNIRIEEISEEYKALEDEISLLESRQKKDSIEETSGLEAENKILKK